MLIDVRTKQDFEAGHIPGAKQTLWHEEREEHGTREGGSHLKTGSGARKPPCDWPGPTGAAHVEEENMEAVQNKSTQSSQDPSLLFIVYDADGSDHSRHVANFISQNFGPGEVRTFSISLAHQKIAHAFLLRMQRIIFTPLLRALWPRFVVSRMPRKGLDVRLPWNIPHPFASMLHASF